MEKTYTTEGIILTRRDHQEFDRIFSIYTKDHGKIEIVGRGTKRIKSKLNSHMNPLYHSKLMVARGRRVDKLAGGNVVDTYSNLYNDSSLLGFTLINYIAEVSDKLIHGELQDERIFNLLKEEIELLDDEINEDHEHHKESMIWFSDIFVVKLLDYLGYRPDVYRCTSCYKGILLPENTFNLLSGGIVCEECVKITFIEKYLQISDTGVKIVRHILENDIETLRKMKLNKAAMDEVHELIDKLLLIHLDKRISSSQFFEVV